MLRLNTSYVKCYWAEPQMCSKCTVLHYISGRFEKNKLRVLELNISPNFFGLTQLVTNVYSIQSTMSSNSCKNNKCFELQIFLHELSKTKDYFVPLFSNESINSMFTRWKSSRFSIFFRITS